MIQHHRKNIKDYLSWAGGYFRSRSYFDTNKFFIRKVNTFKTLLKQIEQTQNPEIIKELLNLSWIDNHIDMQRKSMTDKSILSYKLLTL